MPDLIQMNAVMLKEYREQKVIEQGHVCPVCKKRRDSSEFVVDHQHRVKGEPIGKNGAGLVRGVICKYCNSAEGRVLSIFKRSGLYKDTDLVEFLEGLASYLKQENTNYIHPSEKEKAPRVLKRPYKKLKKMFEEKYPRRKFPEYPKSGKLTKRLSELSEEFGVKLTGVSK